VGGRSRGRPRWHSILMTLPLPTSVSLVPSSPPRLCRSHMRLLQATKLPEGFQPSNLLTAHASAILLRWDALAALLAFSSLPRIPRKLLLGLAGSSGGRRIKDFATR